VLSTLLSAPVTSGPALWGLLAPILTPVQSLAVLEIVHAALGLVRSPVMTTAVQVFSRVFLVWGVLQVPGNTAPQTSLALFTLALAWSVSELIRYPYYALELVLGKDRAPYLLTWLRYSGFLVLYPLGVSSELWLMFTSLPYLMHSGVHSLPMPNAYNISVHYPTVVVLLMLAYIPGFPSLFGYMLAARKKTLHKKPSSSSTTTTTGKKTQ
jgi:hypothetical protein